MEFYFCFLVDVAAEATLDLVCCAGGYSLHLHCMAHCWTYFNYNVSLFFCHDFTPCCIYSKVNLAVANTEAGELICLQASSFHTYRMKL